MKKLKLICTKCDRSFVKFGKEEDFVDSKGICKPCRTGKETFNKNDPKYKAIKITNIVLLIIFYFIEIIIQETQGVKTPNAASVIITFFISRYFIRKIFTNDPDFDYKILKTIGVWIVVMIAKAILGMLLLSTI